MSEPDDFSIELGRSVRRHVEQKKSPREDRGSVALPYDSPETDTVPVFIAERVMRSIETHVGCEMEKEVGGILLGGYYRSGKGAYIEITDFIEAKATVGTDVSLTFTHETWAQLNEEQSRRGPDTQIVGWYHSHPGLGVFMSTEDQFIHSNYFTEPWHVALVVDPISHDWGCFRWNEDSLCQTGGFYVFGDKKSSKRVREYVKHADSSRQATPQSASAGAARRYGGRQKPSIALWGVILLLVITQAITCYMLLTRHPEPEKVDYYAMAIEQLSYSDLSGGEFYLRMALDADREHEQARRELDRISMIRSKASFAGYDNRRLDLDSFRLFTTDKLAEGGIKVKEKSFMAQVAQWLGDDVGYEVHSENPSQCAFDTYTSATDSYGDRLSRAELIARIVSEDTDNSSDKAWYNKAVEHLKAESTKRVAYGMHAGDEDADSEYDKLTKADQEAVTSYRRQLTNTK